MPVGKGNNTGAKVKNPPNRFKKGNVPANKGKKMPPKPKKDPKLDLSGVGKAAVLAGMQELDLRARATFRGQGDKELIKWNEGQKRVLALLEDKNIRELLIASGARSGKTVLIISMIVTRAILFPGSRHLIARKFFAHAKGAIWLDTLPFVLNTMLPKQFVALLHWDRTDFYIRFPNGSEVWIAGLDDKEKVDKILGREYMTIFFNEASEISYDVYTTVKTRLAQRCERRYEDKTSHGNPIERVELGVNRVFVDENPPSSKHWTKVLFVDKLEPETRVKVKRPERYGFAFIHPDENAENLGEDYLEEMRNLPPSKKRRFYDGLFGDDSQYALWSTEQIAKNRVFEHPPLRRIVVAIDPAVSKKDTSDETGIVVKGDRKSVV